MTQDKSERCSLCTNSSFVESKYYCAMTAILLANLQNVLEIYCEMVLHLNSAAVVCHLIGSFPKIPIHLLMAVICPCVAPHVGVSHMSSHVLIAES